MEPIDLYLEKLRLHRVDEDKRGPVTKVLEKHRQDIWAMSNQLRGNRTHSVKMATVDKANKFVTKQRREIARREAQNHTKN